MVSCQVEADMILSAFIYFTVSQCTHPSPEDGIFQKGSVVLLLLNKLS